MEKKEFHIGEKVIFIAESDAIFATAFKIIYDRISLSIDLYKEILLKKRNFDMSKVKNCLVKYYDKEEELGVEEQSILLEIVDFLDNDSADDRRDAIIRTFGSVDKIIREDFIVNNNYGFKECDVAECIDATIKKLQKEEFERLVSIKSKETEGKSFEEYISITDIDEWFYTLETTSAIEFKEDKFLDKYFELYPDDGWDTRAVDVYDAVKKYSDQKNVNILCNQLENDCISKIISILKEMKEKYKIPFPDKYLKIDRYQRFVLSNEVLIKNSNHCGKDPVDSLLSFPFLNKAYIPVLQTIGDSNKELESLANILKVNLDEAKRYVYNKFLNEFNKVDMNNETEITLTYQKILDYKKFLGYGGIGKREQELKQKIDEFDINYRTVNGILYETRQEADEIRSRSFEGKEYESMEQAELVRQEVEKIRSSCEKNSILEKNRIFKELSLEKWETKEAIDELNKIKNAIDAEYKEIKEKANMIEETKDKLKKRGIITGIVVAIMYVYETFLGNLSLIVGIIVVGSTYKSLKNCEKSKELLCQFDRANSQNNNCKINKEKVEKVCAICGAEITDEMKFCVKCGAKLEEEK